MQINGCYRGIKWVDVSRTLVLIALFCGVNYGPSAIAQEGTSPALVQTSPRNDELELLRKSVKQLNAEVARLKAENAKLEKYRQVDYLRDQLVKAEQRVEALQKELVEIGDREFSLP